MVEKVAAEEVDTGKKEVSSDTPVIEEPTTTENGDSSTAEEKKSSEEATANGDSEAATTETDGAVVEAETPAATEAVAKESASASTEENGVEESTEANGDSTGMLCFFFIFFGVNFSSLFFLDSAPAEAVKRKVGEGEAKTDDAVEVTPEKKAKLEETSKEEVQNGAEASEVAA